jgi:molybdopterin converting factor small subunit
MKIVVQLHGELRRYALTNRLELDLRDGATVAEATASLDIRPGHVWLVMLNGHLVEMDRRLAAGDELSLIPPVGGGD